MNQDDFFLARAIELAQKGSELGEGGPFGAVIVREGKIIAEGWNRVVTSHDPTAHAEISAIRSACAAVDSFHLPNSTLYASSEPCPMCLGAIYWARPKVIYFANNRQDASDIGFDDSMIYDEMAAGIESRKIPIISLGREEALEVFKAWKEKADKITY